MSSPGVECCACWKCGKDKVQLSFGLQSGRGNGWLLVINRIAEMVQRVEGGFSEWALPSEW